MTYTYYINYKEDNDNFYKKIYNKIFYKCEMINFDQDKKIININRNIINKKLEKKIEKNCLKDNSSQNYSILISNEIKTQDCKKDYKNLTAKFLMKYMVENIVEYVEKAVETDFRNEEIYMLASSDECFQMVINLSKKFRCINIVTDKIKKLGRLENKLNKNEEILFTITNNRKKSLKRCKILINIDFNNEKLEQYTINRDCIIINLNEEKLKLKNSFHGTVIENIEARYNNRYKNYINEEKFDKTKLYESYIIGKNYKTIREYIDEDCCNIKALKGINSNVNKNELKNNFVKSSIKLDKKQKKD